MIDSLDDENSFWCIVHLTNGDTVAGRGRLYGPVFQIAVPAGTRDLGPVTVPVEEHEIAVPTTELELIEKVAPEVVTELLRAAGNLHLPDRLRCERQLAMIPGDIVRVAVPEGIAVAIWVSEAGRWFESVARLVPTEVLRGEGHVRARIWPPPGGQPRRLDGSIEEREDLEDNANVFARMHARGECRIVQVVSDRLEDIDVVDWLARYGNKPEPVLRVAEPSVRWAIVDLIDHPGVGNVHLAGRIDYEVADQLFTLTVPPSECRAGGIIFAVPEHAHAFGAAVLHVLEYVSEAVARADRKHQRYALPAGWSPPLPSVLIADDLEILTPDGIVRARSRVLLGELELGTYVVGLVRNGARIWPPSDARVADPASVLDDTWVLAALGCGALVDASGPDAVLSRHFGVGDRVRLALGAIEWESRVIDIDLRDNTLTVEEGAPAHGTQRLRFEHVHIVSVARG